MLAALRRTRFYDLMYRYPVLGQFVRYGLVGGLNVGIHFAIFNLLHFAGMHELVANAIAFFISSINSFLLNRGWAFKDPRRDKVVKHYLVFIFFTLVGLALSSGQFWLYLKPLKEYGDIGKNLALLATLPITVAWNFTCYRKWTFNAPMETSSVEA